MKNLRKGEIATVLTIGTLIILGITSFISSNFLKNKQSTTSKAQGYDHSVCNANPSAPGCLGPCTRCETGLGSDGKPTQKCVYHPELEPNCSDDGCSDVDPSRACGTYAVPEDNGNNCPIYKNGELVGRGEKCDNISKCDIAGGCNPACCTVNTVSPDGKKYCNQENGQCSTGYSWGTDVDKLPPKPAWCLNSDKTVNDGKLDMTGTCNQACCGKETDCPRQFCSVPNGACKSGKSCAPSTKVIRTCVGGTACAWTFKDASQGYKDSDYCDAAGLDTDNPPANCVKCTSDAACRSLPAPTSVKGVNKCVDSVGASQSCPGTYEECCARGKSRKVHRECSQSNASGCSYWCEGKDGKRVSCGDPAACVVDSKACTNPALPVNPSGTNAVVCNAGGFSLKKGEARCLYPTNATITCRANNNNPNDIIPGVCPAGTQCSPFSFTCQTITGGSGTCSPPNGCATRGAGCSTPSADASQNSYCERVSGSGAVCCLNTVAPPATGGAKCVTAGGSINEGENICDASGKNTGVCQADSTFKWTYCSGGCDPTTKQCIGTPGPVYNNCPVSSGDASCGLFCFGSRAEVDLKCPNRWDKCCMEVDKIPPTPVKLLPDETITKIVPKNTGSWLALFLYHPSICDIASPVSGSTTLVDCRSVTIKEEGPYYKIIYKKSNYQKQALCYSMTGVTAVVSCTPVN